MAKSTDRGISGTGLIANDVVSAVGAGVGQNEAAHKASVSAKLMDTYNLNETQAEEAYTGMVHRLQNAKLVVYFKPGQLFGHGHPASYQNAFEFSSGNDVLHRNDMENLLFHYDNPREYLNPGEIADRIKRYGDFGGASNPSFRPSIRPKYGTLQIFGHMVTSAESSTYGPSYLILKDYVKHNCTFTHDDSLAIAQSSTNDASQHLSTFIDMGALLDDMKPTILDALYCLATGKELSSGVPSSYRYIEAQIHTDILFSRDVEKICLCHDQRDFTEEDMRQTELISSFARSHNISIENFMMG